MNNSTHFDIIIIGSGPAGSSAAFYLSKNNISTLILEKEKHPRYKTCGGGIVKRALNLLPYNLNGVVEKEIKIVQVKNKVSKFDFTLSKNFSLISMVMREKFDQYLLNKSFNENTLLLENEEVVNISEDRNKIRVITKKNKFDCKFVIAADGVNGITSRIFNDINIKRIPALECELLPDDDSFNRFKDTTQFDFGIVGDGYGWVFPKSDHLSVGVLSFGNSKKNLNIIFKEYLNDLGIAQVKDSKRYGYTIPVRKNYNIKLNNRILKTGDALGLADPVTAEGISYAIQSGALAADAIIKGNLNPEMVSKIYFELLEINILKELKFARFLSHLLYKNKNLRNLIFKKWGRRFSELMTDVISGENSYSNLLKNPVNYFKLLYK